MKKIVIVLYILISSISAFADVTYQINSIQGNWKLTLYPALQTKIQIFSDNEIIVYDSTSTGKYYKYVSSFDGFCNVNQNVTSAPSCNDAYKVSPQNANSIIWFYFTKGKGLQSYPGTRI